MEPSKSDWRLYREKVSGWQENYMERLIKDYITYLSSDEHASTKFWCRLSELMSKEPV